MKDEGMGSGNVLHWVDGTKYVEVMFAKTVNEARECIGYLEDQLIPARLENTRELAQNCGVAVLVPAERFVEASELLAAREEDEEAADNDVDSEDEFEDLDDDLDDDDDDDDDDEDDDDDDDDMDDDDDEAEEPESSDGY